MSQFTQLMLRIRLLFEMIPLILRRGKFKYTPLGDLHEPEPRGTVLQISIVSSKASSRARRLTYLSALSLSLTASFAYIVSPVAHKTNGLIQTQPPAEVSSGHDSTVHPIVYLVRDADARLTSLQSSQSTTLTAAMNEYRRRYAMPPPPHFDRWYEFAVQHGTELIDEFDEINSSLDLFWGMGPGLIRRQVRNILGHANSLMGVTIRDGQVRIVGSGQGDFQAEATREMLSKFSQWLPDMDLAFNINDEPRVIVPHEDVDRLLSSAAEVKKSIQSMRNNFSHPADLGDGHNFEPIRKTPFNRLDHQQTFAHARMSCPPNSPARSLALDNEDIEIGLNFEGITFIDNVTTFSDVCLSPSVQDLIGLFNKPNVFAISHDLLPIFTPSKISTFHDILYPSPYYYAEKTRYDEPQSVQWDQKQPKVYWRGATSGGFSEDGTWRSLLRQSILSKLQSNGTARILLREANNVNDHVPQWTGQTINRTMVAYRYDTKFTEIKQCASDDCADMRDYFGLHPHAPLEDCWSNRYLLDMDGNALSGRFYALLESLSLPLKVSYFREWHMSRIVPWKHYVPLTATTDEYAEVLRFFEEESEGQEIAEKLAVQGREWVRKVARRTDMEVYMFRLLLEYARVTDDDRVHLGFEQ